MSVPAYTIADYVHDVEDAVEGMLATDPGALSAMQRARAKAGSGLDLYLLYAFATAHPVQGTFSAAVDASTFKWEDAITMLGGAEKLAAEDPRMMDRVLACTEADPVAAEDAVRALQRLDRVLSTEKRTVLLG